MCSISHHIHQYYPRCNLSSSRSVSTCRAPRQNLVLNTKRSLWYTEQGTYKATAETRAAQKRNFMDAKISANILSLQIFVHYRSKRVLIMPFTTHSPLSNQHSKNASPDVQAPTADALLPSSPRQNTEPSTCNSLSLPEISHNRTRAR